MSSETWNFRAKRNDFPPGVRLTNHCWDGTVKFLTDHHHRAFAPALKNESTCNLTGHIQQVSDLITFNSLSEIILTGHSYGGMVITGVANLLPEKIRRLVYLDAALPESGQSLFDILELGLAGADGHVRILMDKAPPYVEKIHFDPAKLRSIPKTYIRCTQSEFKDITRMAEQKIMTEKQNWTYLELPSSHVPMADMPDDFCRIMLGQADRDKVKQLFSLYPNHQNRR
jgi:pimeloyl-ACP methyl ester carboxylesterase